MYSRDHSHTDNSLHHMFITAGLQHLALTTGARHTIPTEPTNIMKVIKKFISIVCNVACITMSGMTSIKDAKTAENVSPRHHCCWERSSSGCRSGALLYLDVL